MRTNWRKLLAPLLGMRGSWQLVQHYGTASAAYSAAYMLRRGKFKVPAGIWDFKAQKIESGDRKAEPRWGVWAVYLDAATEAAA